MKPKVLVVILLAIVAWELLRIADSLTEMRPLIEGLHTLLAEASNRAYEARKPCACEETTDGGL